MILLYEDFSTLPNSVGHDEMQHYAAFHFIWVFTICQSTRLRVNFQDASRFQIYALKYILPFKAPITTAADDKFCEIFQFLKK